MSQAHLAELMARHSSADFPCPADVSAIPARATLYNVGPFDVADVPAGFGEERPVLRHESDIFVFFKVRGDTPMYAKLTTNEAGVTLRELPDADALKHGYSEAELADMDVTAVGSCLHYLAENSFGFSTTHPRYTEETWLKPIEDRILAYHGESAARTLQTACDILGMEGYEGYFPEEATTALLQVAQIQSEYHRKVRDI